MATATATSARAGAGIIVWFTDRNEKYVLVGKESRYLTDIPFDATTTKMIQMLQKTDDTDLTTANKYFTKTSKDIENDISANPIKTGIMKKEGAVLPLRIHYDIPTPRKDTTGYSVQYRYLPQNFKRGIVKGGVEPIDKTREDTARREFKEEVGIDLGSDALLIKLITTKNDYVIFTHEIETDPKQTLKAKVDSINKRISERGRKGEVYDLVFKPLTPILSEIDKTPTAYNLTSREAIKAFATTHSKGGRRRSRTKGRRCSRTKGRRCSRTKGRRRHTKRR